MTGLDTHGMYGLRLPFEDCLGHGYVTKATGQLA